jgi:hypothetical protein
MSSMSPRPNGKSATQARNEQLIDQINKGMSRKEVGEPLGLNPTQIENILTGLRRAKPPRIKRNDDGKYEWLR